MKNNNEYVIIDTLENVDIEEIKEFFSELYDEDEPSEEDIQHQIALEKECHLDEFWESLKREDKRSSAHYYANGSCGLWYGRQKGGMWGESLFEMFQNLCDGAYDIKCAMEDGELYLYAYHHDGMNWFCIRKLTPKGVRTIERNDFELDEELADRLDQDVRMYEKFTQEEIEKIFY